MKGWRKVKMMIRIWKFTAKTLSYRLNGEAVPYRIAPVLS
jgi:hypothetical protein